MKIDKKDSPKVVLGAVTFVLISVSYIIFHKNFPTDFIQILPLYVSLVVMFMQTNVNRYAFLLGGLNALFYAAVDVSFGIYASALSAAAISFPIQIVTFINWNRHPYGKSTVFKKLGAKKLIISFILMAAAYSVFCFIFGKLGSQHIFIDNAGLVVSTYVSILCACAYIEYTYIQYLNQAISFALYISMIGSSPERTPYLIYTVYATVCIILTTIKIHQLYKEQQKNRSDITNQK